MYGCNQQVIFLVDLKLTGGKRTGVKGLACRAVRAVREGEGGRRLDPRGTRLRTSQQRKGAREGMDERDLGTKRAQT